ncbi:MAG: hypothetical protein FD135_4684 [Comamonadaceae bacterium]|nr:MAG: hypothetical protein FD135_4684 [Comamonadaceae bacterium]
MKLGLNDLSVWLAALWWGALTAVAFGVVPMLFANLPTPAMAGAMAAKLFSALTWLTLICGLLLMMIFRSNQPVSIENRAHPAIVFVMMGMLAALLTEFAIAPRIIARQDLRLWHSVGSALYALQWVCATVTFRKISSRA